MKGAFILNVVTFIASLLLAWSQVAQNSWESAVIPAVIGAIAGVMVIVGLRMLRAERG